MKCNKCKFTAADERALKIHQTTKHGPKPVGRPTVDTPETRRKIEEAAALDASVEEIAFYAGIHRDTYHEIMKKDPDFSDRVQALRQKPILAARQAANKHMTSSYASAMDYLSRKRKHEFSQKTETETTIIERFDMTDFRSILSVLPQEQQDEVYAVLAAAVADAELHRSNKEIQRNSAK